VEQRCYISAFGNREVFTSNFAVSGSISEIRFLAAPLSNLHLGQFFSEAVSMKTATENLISPTAGFSDDLKPEGIE